MKKRPGAEIKLKIADILIQMQSEFMLEQLTEAERRQERPERFNNFLYEGKAKPDIVMKINIVNRLPESIKGKNIFITCDPAGGGESWRLIKKDNFYIYNSPVENKRVVIFINQAFDKAAVYLPPRKDKGMVWRFSDIIYDSLQILLINYLALRKEGVFIHSIGVKDINEKGLLFAGKSGSGKSTTARLWHRHTRARVLNDDRIIARKQNGKFYIYGSPWHGDFNDYLKSRIEAAPLDKLFFIYHASRNIIRRISGKQAFNLIYPSLFPAFWDKRCLENVVSFSQGLLENTPCFKLGFVNNKRVIEFVRGI